MAPAPPDVDVMFSPSLGRKWPRRLGTTVLVLAILFAVTFTVWVSNYQPLTANGTGSSGVFASNSRRLGSFEAPDGESFTAYRVRFVQGGKISYSFTLGNNGPVPVAITSVGDLGCDSCGGPL